MAQFGKDAVLTGSDAGAGPLGNRATRSKASPMTSLSFLTSVASGPSRCRSSTRPLAASQRRVAGYYETHPIAVYGGTTTCGRPSMRRCVSITSTRSL